MILKDLKQKTLIIVENDKYQSIYEKLFRFFGKFIHKIDNNAKLLDLLLNNNNDFYCIDIDTYNSIKVNINKLKKDSLFIKKNSSFAINELI